MLFIKVDFDRTDFFSAGVMMTKRRLIIFMLAFFALNFHSFADQGSSGPKMVLKENVFDLQQVDEGAVIEHAFIVFNRGDQPLEIKKVKPG